MARIAGAPSLPTLTRVCGLREIGTGIGILTSKDPTPWIWGRVVGDALDVATVGAGLVTQRRPVRTLTSLALLLGVAWLDMKVAEAAPPDEEALEPGASRLQRTGQDSRARPRRCEESPGSRAEESAAASTRTSGRGFAKRPSDGRRRHGTLSDDRLGYAPCLRVRRTSARHFALNLQETRHGRQHRQQRSAGKPGCRSRNPASGTGEAGAPVGRQSRSAVAVGSTGQQNTPIDRKPRTASQAGECGAADTRRAESATSNRRSPGRWVNRGRAAAPAARPVSAGAATTAAGSKANAMRAASAGGRPVRGPIGRGGV